MYKSLPFFVHAKIPSAPNHALHTQPQNHALHREVRKWAGFLHDDAGLRHRVGDRLVRQNVSAVDVELITDDHVLTQNRHIFHPDLKDEQARMNSQSSS